MGLAELGRPRIDVTVRISGVMRDTWPMAVELMDQAVGLAASAEEGDGENYLLKHIRASRARLQDREGANEREAPVRIFGDPPGSYGAGLDLALLASAWKSETDLVKYFIQASAFAYGKGLQGRKSVAAFIENAKTIEASSDITASSRMNPLVCAFGAQVQGGFSLLAKHLGGKPLRSYQNTSERGKAPMIESLGDNLMRLAGETLLNPFWRDSLLAREYEGASELMHILQNVFSAQCLTECFPDGLLDQLTQVYVNDEAMRQWFQRHNPFALEEIARRMLELHSRGKWKPGDEVLQALRESYLAIEGDMEGRTESAGDIQGGALTIVTNSDVAAWKNKLAEIEAYIP
jgi:cobaltochelatase CobN